MRIETLPITGASASSTYVVGQWCPSINWLYRLTEFLELGRPSTFCKSQEAIPTLSRWTELSLMQRVIFGDTRYRFFFLWAYLKSEGRYVATGFCSLRRQHKFYQLDFRYTRIFWALLRHRLDKNELMHLSWWPSDLTAYRLCWIGLSQVWSLDSLLSDLGGPTVTGDTTRPARSSDAG